MKLIAKQAFSWAHRGCEIEHFAKGQEIDTEDQDLIAVSIREGWTEGEKAAKPVATKAAKAAPENK